MSSVTVARRWGGSRQCFFQGFGIPEVPVKIPEKRASLQANREDRPRARARRGRDEPLRAYCMPGVLATSARRVFSEFPYFPEFFKNEIPRET